MLAPVLFAMAVSVTADFEGVNIRKSQWTGENRLRVEVSGESDQDGRNRQPSWFYFRIDGAKGRPLTVEIAGLSGEYNYKKHNGFGLRNMLPVYSHDGREWAHVDKSEWLAEESTIRIRVTPREDRLWIARQPPYVLSDLDRLLADLKKHPYVTETIVGKTVEGRPMRLLTISAPEKPEKVVWLMARQHSWESGTSWVAEGLLRFLVSAAPEAREVRSACVFKVFPMADPDGVARGGVRFNKHGYDLNRNWDAVDPKRMPEIAAQRSSILEWVDSGRPVHLFLTLHNTESADFIQGRPPELAQRFWKLLVDRTTFHSPGGPREASESTTPGMKGRMSVNQGLYRDRKLPAFLMEQMVDVSPKLGRAPTVRDRLEFGAGLARAMCDAVR